MSNIELNFLQNELIRISDWIKFSDSKTAFLAVYYSALVGFLFSKRKEILFISFTCNKSDFHQLLFVSFLSLLLFGIYLLLSSVFPRLINRKSGSLFYFKDISKMSAEEYLNKVILLTDDGIKNQIIDQIYVNSVIANKKMINVSLSVVSLLCSTICLVLLFIF